MNTKFKKTRENENKKKYPTKKNHGKLLANNLRKKKQIHLRGKCDEKLLKIEF